MISYSSLYCWIWILYSNQSYWYNMNSYHNTMYCTDVNVYRHNKSYIYFDIYVNGWQIVILYLLILDAPKEDKGATQDCISHVLLGSKPSCIAILYHQKVGYSILFPVIRTINKSVVHIEDINIYGYVK